MSAATPPYPRPAYAWYVVAVLFIAYVFSFIDRQILSLLVEPIKADLGISDTRMSLLLGLSFALFYTVLGIPIARLADAKSRRAIFSMLRLARHPGLSSRRGRRLREHDRTASSCST